MRVALCLSGMPRNIENSYKWLKESILDILDFNNIDWDIVCSIWGDQNSNEVKLFQNIFEPSIIEWEDWNNDIADFLGWQKFKNHKFEIDPRVNCLGQFYKIYKCNDFRKYYEGLNNIKFDIVVRLRTELRFNNKLDIKELEIATRNKNIIFLRRGPNPQHLNWTKDNFAFGSPEAMDIYSNCFNELLEISQNTKVSTAELILRNYLQSKNLTLEHTSLDYTLVRK